MREFASPKIVVVGLVAFAAGVLVNSALADRGAPGSAVVRAQRFELVDANGTARAAMDLSPDGQVRMVGVPLPPAQPTAQKEAVAVKIKLTSAGVEGGDSGSRGEVAKVISRKNSAVQQCYERALRDNPEAGGKVKISFQVGTAGTIEAVNVVGATGGFANCLKDKFFAIRGLPLLPSPQSFNQSYTFSKN